MIKKGIILAGGKGTRLSPLTKIINKQLLPLYDKPTIFYPLSILMLAEIRDILIITNPNEDDNFKKIIGDGSNFGIKIKYLEQEKPNGLPEAFIIGEKFINNQSVALILGDNFFYGQGFTNRLRKITKQKTRSTIFEQQLSKAGGKLDAVVSANEGLGLAAVAVLKKNGLNGKVCVSGQDATVDGLRAILTGDLSNTVYKAIKAEAEAAAALAIALLNGEEATTATGSVNNGVTDVPSVLLVPVSITKANVKDVIADGFQTREAVCEGIEDLCTANGI